MLSCGGGAQGITLCRLSVGRLFAGIVKRVHVDNVRETGVEEMQIFIKTLTGKSVPVYVSGMTTIVELKLKVI